MGLIEIIIQWVKKKNKIELKKKRKELSTQTKSLNCETLCCRGQNYKCFYGKKSGEISSLLTIEQDDQAHSVAWNISGWPTAGGSGDSPGESCSVLTPS